MADPFLSARLKIERARKHLKELDLEEHRFFDPKPYAVEMKPEVQPSGDTDWVERFYVSKPVPLRLSLIVGDAIHNLRSALDHLACALADLGTGCTDTTAFPIFDNSPEYVRKQAGLLAGIDSTKRGLIESLQPYHARAHVEAGGVIEMAGPLATNFALRAISRLDNRDKHRLLLPAIPVMPFTKRHDWEGVASATVIPPPTEWVRMENGAELCRLREVVFRPGHTEVEMKGAPSFTVVFGDPDRTDFWTDRTKAAVSSTDLEVFADKVEDLIGRF